MHTITSVTIPFCLLFAEDRIDVWSIGCIFAELLLAGKPLFPGLGEIDQLSRIFELVGTPDETNWPDSQQLPLYFEFTHCAPKPFSKVFPGVPTVTLDLLQKMLTLDPSKRISAAEVSCVIAQQRG